MKKKQNRVRRPLLMPVFLAFFALTFYSCASTNYVWDDSLTPDKTATLVFGTGITKIDSFNGVSAKDWTKPNSIVIPAGAAAIAVTATYTVNGYNVTIRYTGNDMLFSYKFDPEKTYYLSFERQESKWGIAIFSSHWARKNQQLAFVPFTNIAGQ
ncbi:MAG: hypothetical protein Ta2A_01680 [Treponemataceae bacterium]|nr:MAG: hypothetical protein Ta2A_01680 [Treponemataceae bacterium]